MMWAYFVKDLKENARWGLLAAALLSALSAYLLYTDRQQRMSVVYEGYQTNVMLVDGLTGIALGMVSMLVELRRGHWGFAVHRPAQRWKLFTAKLLAAASLYLAATSVAMVVAALCAMNPRYVDAPFVCRMMIPHLHYQLTGLLWLAAGMLVAVRQARWVGSRLFPAAMATLFSFLALFLARHYFDAALIILVGVALISLSAAIYFVHNGEYSAHPRWARPLHALMVTSGVGVMLVLGVQAVSAGVRVFRGDARQYNFERRVFDSQGHLYTWHDRAATNLQGRPLSPATTKWIEDNRMSSGTVLLDGRESMQLPFGQAQPYVTSFKYLASIPNYISGERNWSFVPSCGTLVAYDFNGTFAGSIGPDGFRDASQPPQPFPPGTDLTNGPYCGQAGDLLLNNSHAGYVANVIIPALHTILTTPDDQPLIALDTFQRTLPDVVVRGEPDLFDARRPGYALALTPAGVRVLPLATHDVPFEIPMRPDQAGCYLQAGIADDGGLRTLTVDYRDCRRPTELTTFWPGQPAWSLTLPAPTRPAYTPSVADTVTLAAVPPLGTAIVATFFKTYVDSLPPYTAAATVITLLAALVLTFWIARRRTLERRALVTWLVLAALFGLYAPITLACLRARTTRVRCPACGRPHPVDRDACDHCRAPFPPPGDLATSIFEDHRTAA